MWKGEYDGQDVAVKVIRTYSNRELQKMIKVGCSLYSIWVYSALTMVPCIEVLQGGDDLEIPSTSERLATSRRNGIRKRVRDGIKLDDERGY